MRWILVLILLAGIVVLFQVIDGDDDTGDVSPRPTQTAFASPTRTPTPSPTQGGILSPSPTGTPLDDGADINFSRRGTLIEREQDTWIFEYTIPGNGGGTPATYRTDLIFDSASRCTEASGDTVNCTTSLTVGASARVQGFFVLPENTVRVTQLSLLSP